MALTDERKAALLSYCRIDALEEGEELLLQGLYDAAVSYMEGAGISEPQEGTSRRCQYDLCVNAMVLDSWEHRDLKETGASVSVNAAFRWLINQLKLTEPFVSDLDTGQEVG